MNMNYVTKITYHFTFINEMDGEICEYNGMPMDFESIIENRYGFESDFESALGNYCYASAFICRMIEEMNGNGWTAYTREISGVSGLSYIFKIEKKVIREEKYPWFIDEEQMKRIDLNDGKSDDENSGICLLR